MIYIIALVGLYCMISGLILKWKIKKKKQKNIFASEIYDVRMELEKPFSSNEWGILIKRITVLNREVKKWPEYGWQVALLWQIFIKKSK